MSYVVCCVPVAPLRKEAAHRSEMVSQLLLGEFAKVLSDDGDFVHIRGLYDDYEGWCQGSQLWVATEGEVVETNQYCASFHTECSVNGSAVNIPFGSPVYNGGLGIRNHRIEYLKAVQDAIYVDAVPSPGVLIPFAFRYLNTGYLWGGKSVYGTDCSGFVQQVFKLCGIRLPRDAYQQAEGGVSVGSLQESKVGDLAFFHNESGRVTHVGLLLDEGKIIHASGRVRVDGLQGEGIVTGEGVKTHSLHSIRRYW